MRETRSWLWSSRSFCPERHLDCTPILAAPTSRQRSTINTLKRKATRVEEYCRQQDFDAAADEYREIQSQFDRMLGDAEEEPDLIPLLEPLYRQMIRVACSTGTGRMVA
jgi:hypothetical protein